MSTPKKYNDNEWLEEIDETTNSIHSEWPISEGMLMKSLDSYMMVEDIAEEYSVSVSEVIDLCEKYDLDYE